MISKGQRIQLEVGDYGNYQNLIPVKIVKPYNKDNSIVEFKYAVNNAPTQFVISNAEINFESFSKNA